MTNHSAAQRSNAPRGQQHNTHSAAPHDVPLSISLCRFPTFCVLYSIHIIISIIIIIIIIIIINILNIIIIIIISSSSTTTTTITLREIDPHTFEVLNSAPA